MSIEQKRIYVYSNWGNELPMLVGMLYAYHNRGNELFSFEYNNEWIHSCSQSLLFDPDLSFYEGRQYVPQNKTLFGVFTDSCPDRWGRLLLNRKETLQAKKEGRKPRALTESDYLLGVYDITRMGALRFALQKDGPFLESDTHYTVPTWVTLRTLESASMAFEKNDDGQDEKWLSQLLAPGSSLGGARPKASVSAPDGSLWIAKFPSLHDEWNIGAWEMVAHDLAMMCGLSVPEAKLANYSNAGSTFLVKRFDRDNTSRIHFSSAMTMLGKVEGYDIENISYLNLASFIKSNGCSPKKDLFELWKRIVFNIAISNNDDHLRNHGFLLTSLGWRLSPLFDVNPNIYGNTLSLNINKNDNTINFDLALETAKYYNITLLNATKVITNIKEIVENKWRSLAAKHGLAKNAINQMEPAFTMEYKQ